jgi:asparagine synthase (glutamine-hydrolysing)
MSGIVGIVNFDGAPIDRALLSRMTASLDFRGPDARHLWIADPPPESIHGSGSDPCAGFGHTLLRTSYEAEHEQQPSTFDGHTWIVADCRVDAREELLAKLRTQGRDASLHRPDVELILHAWHVWGEMCVDHLLGDFAFAIWDAPRHRLFCARDHLGVKPFYYAYIDSTIIFSNTLDCVRLHPAVSLTLNDRAVADFLLFAGNQVNGTTMFADIFRVPPAHTVTWTPTSSEKRRYWVLPDEDPIYYRDDRQYTERFLKLLREAVADRLRTTTVSVFMSGGLDSPGLAAVALELLRSRTADPVHAFTSVYNSLMPDSERYYAAMVATHLGIPIQFFAVDQQTAWAEPGFEYLPEPTTGLLEDGTVQREQYRVMAAHSRVAFYGEGPDNALCYEWRSHLTWLASQKRWARLAGDFGKHLLHHKRVPLLPTVPKMIRTWRGKRFWEPSFPDWLDEGLVERLGLRDRWREVSTHPLSRTSTRPRAHSSFESPDWQDLFENLEPPVTNTAIEVRHPFVDIRLLRFLLRVPAVPWCRKKQLLRRAFRGLLPEAVLTRPKTPLAKKPLLEQAKLHGSPPLIQTPELSSYGRPPTLGLYQPENIENCHIQFRFVALSYWLTGLKRINKINQEDYYGVTEDVVPRGTR